MGLLIGMDEAGYGPNLGPLVVTVTVWSVPRPPRDFDMWSAMSDVAAQSPSKEPLRLHIADSKKVYAPGKGLAALEKSVLSALRMLDRTPQSLSDLVDCLAGNRGVRNGMPDAEANSALRTPHSALPTPPWLTGRDLQLPTATDSTLIGDIATKWFECCRASAVKLTAIRSAIVQPESFNSVVRACDNKSLALSRISLNLLRSVWNPDDANPTLVICDKHGGRNRYGELLADVLDGRMLFTADESLERSVYRVGASELRFSMKAETYFPVALASLVCKYVRELSMDLFNQFWAEQIPGIKPTAGYPVDAARFRTDIAEAQHRLGITDDVLWRER